MQPTGYGSGTTLVVMNRVVMCLVADARWGAVFLDTLALVVVFLALILVGFFVAIRYHLLSDDRRLSAAGRHFRRVCITQKARCVPGVRGSARKLASPGRGSR